MKIPQETPMISIIVPVYNVEPYLEKCLDSLAAQTYQNLEIIIVNDASTDGSGQICEAYARRDTRMHIIHFPVNRGLSAARNEGVGRAAGKYITFIDSDDYVNPCLVEKLHANLAETRADISVCGIDGIGSADTAACTYSREETVRCMARRTPFLWNVWGKLYLTESVKAHPFDEGALCCEDLLFFYQMLKDAKKVSYLPDKLYHYLYRPGSLINSGINEKRCIVLSVLDGICEDASVNFPEAAPGLGLLALDTGVRLALQAVENGAAEGNVPTWLNRFQRHVRQHFSWKAMALGRDAKTTAAVLLLYTSTKVFRGAGSFYKCCKHIAGAANRS